MKLLKGSMNVRVICKMVDFITTVKRMKSLAVGHNIRFNQACYDGIMECEQHGYRGICATYYGNDYSDDGLSIQINLLD